MSHYNTVFSQRLKLIPRHEFETLANQHRGHWLKNELTHGNSIVIA